MVLITEDGGYSYFNSLNNRFIFDIMRACPNWLCKNLSESLILLAQNNIELGFAELLEAAENTIGKESLLKILSDQETAFYTVCGPLLLFSAVRQVNLDLFLYLANTQRVSLENTFGKERNSLFIVLLVRECITTCNRVRKKLALEIATVLIRNTNVNYKNTKGETAISYANFFIDSLMPLLIEQGANVLVESPEKTNIVNSTLHFNAHLAIFPLLFETAAAFLKREKRILCHRQAFKDAGNGVEAVANGIVLVLNITPDLNKLVHLAPSFKIPKESITKIYCESDILSPSQARIGSKT